jgi:hypothetical protein
MENNVTTDKNAGKDNTKKYFFRITAGIEAVLLIILLILVYFCLFRHTIDVRTMLALALMIIWFGIVILYLSWSTYYYNINMGITDADWKTIEEARFTSTPMNEPTDNPNSDQSLGLPPGTIRAIIALTLLVAVLSLAIIYFGNEKILRENEIFIDSLDFFKTAFLMMIAFYFGSKSLEILKAPDNKSKVGTGQKEENPPVNDNKNPL